MPPRRDLTVEDIREQSRLRSLQYRARQRASRDARSASRHGRHVTPIDGEAARHATVPPSHTLPPPGLSTTDRLLERLAPFASRAFKPDPAFLALLAERYPAVDLELELAAALDWLEEPRHAKRRCSKGFLANWVKKADADRKAREAAPPPPSRRELMLQGQPYHQPQSQQPNRRPGAPRLLTGDLVPYDRNDYREFQTERRKLTLPERVAQYKGAAK